MYILNIGIIGLALLTLTSVALITAHAIKGANN
jgi:hypothetical protein